MVGYLRAQSRLVLEKTGGDSMAEVIDNLHRYQERIARTPAAPAPGARDGGHIAPSGRDAARGAG